MKLLLLASILGLVAMFALVQSQPRIIGLYPIPLNESDPTIRANLASVRPQMINQDDSLAPAKILKITSVMRLVCYTFSLVFNEMF